MKKHKPEELKIEKKFTVFCKECEHQHIAKTGPCIKFGCGCHGADKPVGAWLASNRKRKEKK